MLCFSRRGALKEKVTSHPPVSADATSEMFGRGARDALGMGTGMTTFA